MQPVSNVQTAKGRVQMSENTLLMSVDATAEATAGPSDDTPAAPEVPTWDPVERWRGARKFAWVLLIDAAIYFVISMITFAIVNIVVSAVGLAAGIVWFVFFFLRFGTQSAIKVCCAVFRDVLCFGGCVVGRRTIVHDVLHVHVFLMCMACDTQLCMASQSLQAFYWPGIVGGVLATLCAIWDFVWAILKIVDSPVGGSLYVVV